MRRARALVMLALGLAVLGVSGADAQEHGQQRDVVRIAFPQEDGSLTPYTFRSGYGLVTLVYDTLLLRDRRGVPRPWLARSVRRDRDGRSVTVRLQRGVRWHDGRPLTAEDVAFTFRRVASRPHPRFTPQVGDIASVTPVDPRTVVFRLRRASLGFHDQPLADVPILPRHLWEALPPGQIAPAGLPVGSGPYRLTAHDIGRRYRFQANKEHFSGATAVRRIEVPIVRRQDSALEHLADRRVDAVPVALSPRVRRLAGRGVRLADGISYSGTMLAFDVSRPPFDRVEVRRAVANALDLTELARLGGEGTVAADRGVLHPRSRWAADAIMHRVDRAQARRAFAELGVPPVRILAPANDIVRVAAGERIVRALGEVGARARLVAATPPDFERALGRGDAPGDFDAAVVGFPRLASYDPAFLTAVFGDPRRAPLNNGGYRSPTFERLSDRVASAKTGSARQQAVTAELRLLADDLPAVPLFFGTGTFAYRPKAYDGWVDVRGTGILDKRSFTHSSRPARSAAPTAVDPLDTDDGSTFSLVPVILGLAAVLLLAATLWLRRSRP